MTTPEHPPPSRRYPAVRPMSPGQGGTVPLGQAFQTLPEGGYPDAGEAGLAYAAGQRNAARTQENRTALTTGPGAPDTPTMYPTAYGQTSSNSDANDAGVAATPPSSGTVAAAQQEKADADKKKKKAKGPKRTGRRGGR
jgi:hypothetical protein